MLGSGSHHDLSDGAVARVEDVVEPFGEQFGGLGHPSGHDLHDLTVEVGEEPLVDEVGRRRRDFRRLQD
jgi:hypothetical protein